METDIGEIPEGWRVLWCQTCLASLMFTEEDMQKIFDGDLDQWLSLLDSCYQDVHDVVRHAAESE